MKEQQKLEPVPGPWVAVGKVVKSDCGRDSVTVTRVDSRGKFVEGYDEANARLIAAAPELYEQCKRFERVLSELVVMGEADIRDRDKLRGLLAKVVEGEERL